MVRMGIVDWMVFPLAHIGGEWFTMVFLFGVIGMFSGKVVLFVPELYDIREL